MHDSSSNSTSSSLFPFALLFVSIVVRFAGADPFFSLPTKSNIRNNPKPSPMSAAKTNKWFPLESNPQLINDYIRKLGFNTSIYEFCDVFSTEDWALDMIPQPVAAVLLLYPITEKITQQEEHPENEKESPALALDAMQDQVWFIKQRIGNACGTIGLLHATMNVPEGIRMWYRDSWFAKFADDCPIPLSPVAKAERLEGDSRIAKFHDEATSSKANSTQRGSIDDKVETHFAALVHVGGQLYELDGRKEGPIRHGPTTQATLLKDSCTVIKKLMARDPSETRFAITALAPKQMD